jgi:hypothetical protein
MTYAIGNPGLAWNRHNNVVGLNRLMGSQLAPLDNWIFNGIHILV